MGRSAPARRDGGNGGSRKGVLFELTGCIRGGTRIAVVVILLLSCFGREGLWAATTIVRRSTRAIPHRFTVHPNGATVAANKTQRFEVTDSQGRPVAVHWNVSGIGCSGVGCGTVDDHGVYRTPSSLPQPREVILEGVLVSDPNYSVLTQVRLEDAINDAVTPSQPYEVAAAPVLGRQNLATTAKLTPLPNPVAAAPVVGRQSVALSAELTPLPGAVAAPPVLGKQNLATTAKLTPLPNPVAAAPAVGRQSVARTIELTPLPGAIAAPPVVGKQTVAISASLAPLPNPVPAAPVVGGQTSARSVELTPIVGASAAAPVGERQIVASRTDVAPLRGAVAAASATFPMSVPKTQQLTATGVEKQSVATKSVLQAMPEAAAASAVGNATAMGHSPVVTYRDGQLTIDAENSSLAEVLRLVAEKTGAVIEVPAGSGLERIVEHTGPGQADDVLAQLLNGSSFDFIIVGSPQRPHNPTQVLLSLHGAETPGSLTSLASAQPQTSSAATLWTPPAEAPAAAIPYELDRRNMEAPKEAVSPEDLGKMMRERAQMLREKLQPQQ